MDIQENKKILEEQTNKFWDKHILETFQSAYKTSYICEHKNGHLAKVRYLWFWWKEMWFCSSCQIYFKSKPKV